MLQWHSVDLAKLIKSVIMLYLPPYFVWFNLGGVTNDWPSERFHYNLFSHQKSPQFSSHCIIHLHQFNWNPACHLWISLKITIECGSHYYSHMSLMIVPITWSLAIVWTVQKTKTKNWTGLFHSRKEPITIYLEIPLSILLVLCMQDYWHGLLGDDKRAKPSFIL